MNKHSKFRVFTALIFTLATSIHTGAHVTLLFPVGGEIFSPGEEITVKWQVDIPHEQENWDLYYSSDGGETWTEIITDLNKDSLQFKWVSPEQETDRAKIKIVMDNISADYESVNLQPFSIKRVSDLFDQNLFRSLFFYRGNGHSTVFSFETDSPKEVVFEVFDLNGILLKKITLKNLVAGKNETEFNLPSSNRDGLFIYSIETNGFRQSGIFFLR